MEKYFENILPEIKWVNSFKSTIQGLSHKTFFSKSMKREIGYGVYVPKNYNSNSRNTTKRKERLPVIYWLHGKGGDESTGFNLKIPEIFDEAIEKGRIDPAMIVFPNCGNFSMFCDSYDSLIMGETILVKELIPHIDRNFKTIDSGEGRALEGFSMGGFGAVKLAFKFPELFSSVVTQAGSFHDLKSLQKNRPEIFYVMFSGNTDYFQQNSPYVLVEKNLKLIKSKVKLKFLNGSKDFTLKNNYKLNTRLDSVGVKYKFKLLDGLKHAPWLYYEAEGLNGFKFHSDNFQSYIKNN